MEVIFSKRANKSLKLMDKKTKERITNAIDALPTGDVVRLEARVNPAYRLRVGGYRVLFDIDYETEEILVDSICPRGDAYKK